MGEVDVVREVDDVGDVDLVDDVDDVDGNESNKKGGSTRQDTFRPWYSNFQLQTTDY